MPLTANEQFLLELINRARLDPQAEAARYGLADLNQGLPPGTVSSDPLQPLAFSEALQNAARAHSQWMLDTDIFSHSGAGGSTPSQRMAAAGYDFTGSGYDGGAENISRRGTTGQLDLSAAIDAHHSGLFLSDGHRRNMMGAEWREVGLAQVAGQFTNNGTAFNSSMLTQNFAPSARVFLTGVVYDDTDNDNFYSRGEGRGGVAISVEGGASAASAAAGGYTVAVTPGWVTVALGGTKLLVDVTTANAKVDLIGSASVASSADIAILEGVSQLTLLGAGDIDATGSAAAEHLLGNRGANRLAGGGGADTLAGGAGDDTYVDPDGALIVEHARGGVDTVESRTAFDLSNLPEVENLRLTGQADIAGTGNDRDNLIVGNAGANRLQGGVGRDTLIGGAGDDTYVDPEGDEIVERDGEGSDTIESNTSRSLVNHRSIENITLLGDAAIDAAGDGAANRLTGNAGANRLSGGDGNDTLIGAGGIDTLIGGAGDDLYVVDADVVEETAGGGDDTIESAGSLSLLNFAYVEHLRLTGERAISGWGTDGANLMIGNAAANRLTGYAGDDTMAGGGGVDTLIGGAGNDLYLDPQGDVIEEAARGGLDWAQSDSSLSLVTFAGVENLRLTGHAAADGWGNELGNLLVGNGAANRLTGYGGDDTIQGGDGNDTIAGGDGADELIGGLGDDVYVDWTGDRIVELAGEGSDWVEVARSFTLADLPEIENVRLTGTLDLSATGDAVGNHLAGNDGNNTLIGLAGGDTLEGGAGADTLEGGLGNDVYVNPLGDTIIERAGQGFDRVVSNASFSLATVANVERLELTGSTPSFLRGNNAANQLIGNSGSNTLFGFDGNDTLYGLGGRDTIIGGLGRDAISPGIERDTLRFAAVAESTGSGGDVVDNWIFAVGGRAYEMLDFPVLPTAVRDIVTLGSLNDATFDADLQRAVGAAQMGAGEAVLFDPTGGDRGQDGRIYLIVDANGLAGYQAGEDYVVEFINPFGTLSLGNFI